MRKVGVITTTRAEYSLLRPVVDELRKKETAEFRLEFIVTGTHLSEEFGMTIEEIEEDGIRIDHKIPIPVDSRSPLDISRNQASALMQFTEFFIAEQYNAIVLLGDRYEILAVAIAAGNTGTPIFHIAGGDTTQGAVDEWIRHSVTKMSYLHFPTNEISRRRVLQLGETPDRVFNYGATSIDNIMRVPTMTKQEALASIGLLDCCYAVGTYHPTTMEIRDLEDQLLSFLNALRHFRDIQFVITKANADQGGAWVNKFLDTASEVIPNIHVFTSLGMKRYLSLVKHSEFVIGNSSSGIVEAPALGVPTVNIGDRQKGRLQSESIINCDIYEKDIISAIKKAMSLEHKELCKRITSPYGNGHAAEQIARKTHEVVMENHINLKKEFYKIL